MSESLPPLFYLLFALLFIVVLACLFLLMRGTSAQGEEGSAVDKAILEERLSGRDRELRQAGQNLEALQQQLQHSREENLGLKEQLSRQETLLQQQHQQYAEKLQFLQNAEERLKLQFQSLAESILEQKGRNFSESSQKQLQDLLKPLGEKIQLFEKKVEETYDKESKQRFALEKEIRSLLEINNRISIEADNLTKALKGDSKVQGNWGEIILERVLEKSGLQKGREYEVQVSLKDESGSRSQPDVIVHLPEGKDVIIDSKVSLKDYEAHYSAADEYSRELHLKQHIRSIRNHISELSGKNYQQLKGITSLDFVLLFIPVEPAFTLALQHDDALFGDAFASNIILVGPSTLLATLRTIQSLWRIEYQNKNAMQIAENAGKLYDQFVAFTRDLDKVGEHLDKGHLAWEEACKRLSTGRGNLVRRAENIRKLGAKAARQLGENWLEDDVLLEDQSDNEGAEGDNTND